MNLNGTIKKTQALSGRLVKSSGGGGSVQEIYWVQYGVGTATNAEVNTAVTANKLPVCYWDSTNAYGQTTRNLYYLIKHTPTEALFATVDNINETIIVRRLYADSWYTQTIRYEGRLTWDNTPRFGSVNPVTSGGIYNAIQNATVSDERIAEAVDDWMDANVPSIGTLSYAAKQALLNCFAHVAWIDDQGQSYYNALESELFPDATLESITAVFTQGSATIYDTYTLDALKQYLVVTATYSDSTTATVTDYTLSGDLEAGTSAITASYGGKTATFNVTVTSRIPSAYRQVEYLQSDLTQALQTNIAARNTRTLCTFQYVAMRSDNGSSFVTGGFNTDNQRYLAVQLWPEHVFAFVDRNATAQWQDNFTNPTVDIYAKHTFDFNNASHQALIDGVVKATAATFACTAGDWKIAIFCRGRDNTSTYLTNTSASRIFALLYENNDTGLALGEFIPCYRKSDNVGGMYDLVSQQFYTDVLNGNPFVWGAEHWESGT